MSDTNENVYQNDDGEWLRKDGVLASWVDMQEAGYRLKARKLADDEKEQPGDVMYYDRKTHAVTGYERIEWVKET